MAAALLAPLVLAAPFRLLACSEGARKWCQQLTNHCCSSVPEQQQVCRLAAAATAAAVAAAAAPMAGRRSIIAASNKAANTCVSSAEPPPECVVRGVARALTWQANARRLDDLCAATF